MSGFTEFFACMRLCGDKWGDMRIFTARRVGADAAEQRRIFRTRRIADGLRCARCTGSVVLFCAKQAITRLNIEAGERLLPMADEGKVLDALLRLVDNERHLLYDGGRFFCVYKTQLRRYEHLSVSCRKCRCHCNSVA